MPKRAGGCQKKLNVLIEVPGYQRVPREGVKGSAVSMQGKEWHAGNQGGRAKEREERKVPLIKTEESDGKWRNATEGERERVPGGETGILTSLQGKVSEEETCQGESWRKKKKKQYMSGGC